MWNCLMLCLDLIKATHISEGRGGERERRKENVEKEEEEKGGKEESDEEKERKGWRRKIRTNCCNDKASKCRRDQ